MPKSFELRPTRFSRGEKYFAGGFTPRANPLVTGLNCDHVLLALLSLSAAFLVSRQN